MEGLPERVVRDTTAGIPDATVRPTHNTPCAGLHAFSPGTRRWCSTPLVIPS